MTVTQESSTPHPIDVHVGQRVRQRRLELKMSHEALSYALDISFQQVQKYERGANRISASKLFVIAQTLDVPIDYFCEGLPEVAASAGHLAEDKARAFLSSREGLELAAAFVKLSSAKRRFVANTVRSLAALYD